MIQTMKKLKSGYINGTRVMLGNLGDFLNTSAITDLSFLGSQEDGYPDSNVQWNKIPTDRFRSRILFDLFSRLGLNPDVQAYLNEHLFRSFSMKSTINVRQTTLRPRQLRRRMSCKGAIKKTRSINADSDTLGMEGNVIERRTSTVAPTWTDPQKQSTSAAFSNIIVTPPSNEPHHRARLEKMQEIDSDATSNIQIKDKYEGTNEDEWNCVAFIKQIADSIFSVPKIQLGQAPIRTRPATENNFADTEVEELIAMLRETENLEEQGDILQYLVDTQGLDYNTGMIPNVAD